ncbi:MAG: sensor histidine kinase [Bacteriovorax sp.]
MKNGHPFDSGKAIGLLNDKYMPKFINELTMRTLSERLFEGIDFLLPRNFKDQVSIRFYYRARIIATINFICVFFTFIVFLLSITLVHRSNLPKMGIGLAALYLIFNMVFFRSLKSNFEKKFLYSAIFQIFLLAFVSYFVAFSKVGLGIFGSIWLVPLILMIAFYFDKKISVMVYSVFTLLFLIFIGIEYDQLFLPIQLLPNFNRIYVSAIVVNFFGIFAIAWIFSLLMEQLQSELSDQRELLIASAKFNSLGQMASTLAHDINNPLFLLQNRLHLIRTLLSRDQLDLNRCDEIIKGAEKTIEKLSSIAQGISTYAREGRVDEMIIMSASDLVKNNLDIAFDRIEKNGIALKSSFGTDVDIICHPSFLSQVILNLVNNSIDALEESHFKEITVRVEKEDKNVHISICDSGPGIPPEYSEQIFKPFFTTKKFNKGTGLGLSISQGLVALHQGSLIYKRLSNQTYFIATIPHADSQMSD